MARKSGPNKSEAIREVLTKSPEMAVKEVVSTLASKGMRVMPNLVYFIKGKLNAKAQRKTRVVRAAQEASMAGRNGIIGADPLTLIREIKALARKSGGIGNLKALIEAMAE